MDDLHGSGDGLSESSTTEEMARLLLAGWTMLADTCSECRDVPLMRNNDGALKCCRCKKESRDASHRVASASSEASRSVPTGIGERHKYSIVSEYGLDSCALSGIHGVDGDRVLSTMPVVKPAAPVVATEGRRLQQLCLLRVELSKALDRYTGLLHHSNENVSCDVRSDSEVLEALDRTLRLLSTVESKL